jgi:DNA-binding NtrC family response regulator
VAAKTILIVDDDEIYAYALGRFLQSRGYTLVVTNGSFAALRELETKPVDLVITDLRLHAGEPHGASLGRMIRNRRQDMPVILITACVNLAELEQPLPGPVFDKSTPFDDLGRAVEDALAAN